MTLEQTPRIGLLLPSRETVLWLDGDLTFLIGAARLAEQAGYDSLWVGDSLPAPASWCSAWPARPWTTTTSPSASCSAPSGRECADGRPARTQLQVASTSWASLMPAARRVTITSP